MSLREAETFNEAWTDAMEELSDSIAQETERTRAEAAPARATAPVSHGKAGDGWHVRRRWRGRMPSFSPSAPAPAPPAWGADLAGTEYDGLQVRQILPENIAAAQKADQLDVAIDVMKRRLDPTQNLGPTLMQFIAREGGIVDTGGDLKSMGADAWHRGKPGQRRPAARTGRAARGWRLRRE